MKPLLPWMRVVLRIAGCYNVLAGVGMIGLYHEGYELLRVQKPSLILPVQVMGILVALFGIGYHMVASNPIENRNILLLGFLSKAIASGFAYYYIFAGAFERTPAVGFGIAVFFSDVIYLVPFWLIMRRIYALADQVAPPG